jgi:putative ABC transport system permease protein
VNSENPGEDADQIRRSASERRWENSLESVLGDIRFALRSLRKDLRVALTALLALALGIGSSTIIFSVFDSLLLDPFPYKDSNRLVTFSIRNTTSNGSSIGRRFYSVPEFVAFREQNRTFEDMVGYSFSRNVLYNDGHGTRSLPGMAAVSTNTFAFLGVAPLLGRSIGSEDGSPSVPPVFVMNYRLWRTEFNSDPTILGRTFLLNGVPRVLIGIMPARFNIYGVGVWVPANLSPGGETFEIVGRLKRGVKLQNATADLDVIAHQLTKDEPGSVLNPARYTIVTERLIDVVLGSFTKALYALLAAVFMLLLIACTNVANLLLARATVREKEIAVRAALGASRGRLVRQLLVESLLLSAAACGIGCVLAFFGLKLVATLIPHDVVPGEAVIGLNWAVLWFALGITMLTTLICGFAPAMHVVRSDLQCGLAGSGKGVSGFRHGRLRGSLVVAEVALSIVLLIGGGLTMRNFLALTHVPLPFDPARTLYAQLALPLDRYYGKPDKKPAFFQQLLPRIKGLPGVMSVAESLMLPPNEGAWTDVVIPGKPHAERWVTDLELCTEGYFPTLGLQLLHGRLLSQNDVDSRRYVAVVNETLARKYFGAEDPIGQKIKFEVLDRPFVDGPHNTYFEIVGVIADFKTRPERTEYILRPEAFLPASVAGFGYPLHIVVKTALDPHALLKSVQREIWAVDPQVALSASGSIEDILKAEFRAPQFEFMTLSAFAGIGLVLVVIGVFSVMNYTVSLRTHEIGVRMALGAEQRNILGMVLKKGITLIVAGTLIGVLASFGLTRFLSDFLWGVSATDPWAFAAAVAAILMVGSAACLWPARRAAQVDPSVTLRYE